MINRKILLSPWIVLLLCIGSTSCRRAPETGESAGKYVEIRGIYGSPAPFWKKGLRLDALHVNAVFIHGGSIDQKTIERAREEGAKVFAEFPTLNGKGYVEEHPEAWPVNEKGEKAEAASWFMGVCPTEPGFKRYRMNQLTELLRRLELDGVWLDYVHWHAQFEEPEPILPETCFCYNCLTAFQAASDIGVPGTTAADKAEWILKNHETAWRNWRASVIAGWVRDSKRILLKHRPGALLGVYHCPWTDEEYNEARRRNLGLDYDMLKEAVDVFSPMVYHGRMGRDPGWVKENIEWFSERMNGGGDASAKIWPIVQAHNSPREIGAAEFEKVLRFGASAGATGVMMFTSNSVAEDDAKTETMKKVYAAWMK